MTEYAKFTVGERLLITSGEYSDYQVLGSFIVVKDFDSFIIEEATRSDLEHNEELYDSYACDFYKTCAWLAKNNYIQDEPTREIYLGGYGNYQLNVTKLRVQEDD